MKIEIHYTYYILAFSFIICGYFANLIILTSIIIIHEMGHYFMAICNNIGVNKIVIYSFGGVTKLNINYNESILKEFMIAISGIVVQILYFLIILCLYRVGIIRLYVFNIFKSYNYIILLFNLIPVYPLDGGKILVLFLYNFLPFSITNKICVYISFILIFFIDIYAYLECNYAFIIISSFIINNLINYYKNLGNIFNRFLLERYLYRYRFRKVKIIKNIRCMYKNKNHIFIKNGAFYRESTVLYDKFNNKSKKMFD